VLPLQILGGRYRLDEVLGVGGMSVVWKATDEVLGRAVAVKILAGDFALDPDARAAVLAEAQAVAGLSHPDICKVFDYGESVEANGHIVPYVVMELLTGQSLADRLDEGPLAPQEALKIAAEVAAGLAAAHAHGVVHRDVKPGNIILMSSGAKVFDFGIAAIAGAPDLARPDGHILATPSYVAPERLRGGTVLPASDMFGWGVLLFRLLTGRLPWPSWVTLADRLSAAAPMPPMPGITEKISDLYLSCIAENPDDRPTAAAAAAVVRVSLTVRTPQPSDVLPRRRLPYRDAESVSLGAIADADRRRRRRRAVVLAAGLVAVLAAGAFAFRNDAGKNQGGPPPSQATTPFGEAFAGSAPPGDPNPSPTNAPPGDLPVGAGPRHEVPVRGIPGPTVTVTVPGGNPPVVGPGTSFSTRGGSVVVVCDTYGPRVASFVAKPGYYSTQLPLIFALFVFFTKPADGANPSLIYRLTIKCSSSGVPTATVASYTGDQPVTPAPAAPAATAASPSP
jgi:eukaryotic-like serine/threonine-protein kinase